MSFLWPLKAVRPISTTPPLASEERRLGNRSVQLDHHVRTEASQADRTPAKLDSGSPPGHFRSNGFRNWCFSGSETFQADISKNNFDIIRLCLAFLVIFSHSYLLLPFKEPLVVFSGYQAAFGDLAVTAFFMISGFLVTRSWDGSRTFQSYIKKRICRIYPGFLVASLFCLFIVGPLGAGDKFNYWREVHPLSFAASLLMLQPHFPQATFLNLATNAVNGSLWSVPLEFCCYLSIPVVGFLGCIRKRGKLLALFTVSMALLVAKIQLVPSLPFPCKIVTAFLSGALFYLYSDCIQYKRSLLFVSLVLLLFSAVAANLRLLHIFLPVFGSYILFYVAFVPSRALGFAKSLTRGNDISYGVYLYGWPIQQLIIQAHGRQLTPLSLFVLAILGSTVLGAISWFFVERRFLARRTGQ